MLIAAGAGVLSVAMRRDAQPATPVGGNVGACARLGDPVRRCSGREVGRELSAVGASAAAVTIATPASSVRVTFVSTEEAAPLLCELHARVGVVDARVPSWLGWNEPLAGPPPQ